MVSWLVGVVFRVKTDGQKIVMADRRLEPPMDHHRVKDHKALCVSQEPSHALTHFHSKQSIKEHDTQKTNLEVKLLG